MKKVAVLTFVVLSMILSLVGCGNSNMTGINDVANIDKSMAVENASNETVSGVAEFLQNANAEKLSAVDLSEFKFTLEGEELQIPFYVTALEKLGWEVGNNTVDYRKYKLAPEEQLLESTRLVSKSYSQDAVNIDIYVGNYSDKRLRGTKCAVSGFSIKANKKDYENLPAFALNGGITFGSTYDEIVSALGEPVYMGKYSDGSFSMEYETENMWRTMSISLDTDKCLNGVTLYLGVDAGIAVNGTPHVTEEDTPINWSDFKFALDGNRLQIPFAVSELTEQGWYPKAEELDFANFAVYPGESSIEIVMEHERYTESNDTLMAINLANTKGENQLGQDCEVRRLYIRRNHGTNIPELVLDGDIMIGDTEEDIIDAYGEPAKVGEYDGDKLLVYLNENATREMKLYIDEWEGITIIELCDYEGTQKAEDWHWVDK